MQHFQPVVNARCSRQKGDQPDAGCQPSIVMKRGGTTPTEKRSNTQLLSYFHAFKKVRKKTGKEVTPRELENLMLELGPEVLRCPLIPSQ